MRHFVFRFLVGAAVVVMAVSTASADLFDVTVTNNAATGGVGLTPVFVGFHDGNFDVFNVGAPASSSLELLAETGNSSLVSTDFTASQASGVQGSLATAPPPPLLPGESVTTRFDLTPGGANDFFSFASMVIPSNDFFIGNDNATAHSIAALFGTTNSLTIDVSTVYDAGTEAEDVDNSAGNPLFPALPPGDMVPGADTSNPIAMAVVPGFLAGPLDFSATAGPLATITITAVPEPTSAGLLGLGLIGMGVVRRRRRTI